MATCVINGEREIGGEEEEKENEAEEGEVMRENDKYTDNIHNYTYYKTGVLSRGSWTNDSPREGFKLQLQCQLADFENKFTYLD